jgi:hypothetical protein
MQTIRFLRDRKIDSGGRLERGHRKIYDSVFLDYSNIHLNSRGDGNSAATQVGNSYFCLTDECTGDGPISCCTDSLETCCPFAEGKAICCSDGCYAPAKSSKGGECCDGYACNAGYSCCDDPGADGCCLQYRPSLGTIIGVAVAIFVSSFLLGMVLAWCWKRCRVRYQVVPGGKTPETTGQRFADEDEPSMLTVIPVHVQEENE